MTILDNNTIDDYLEYSDDTEALKALLADVKVSYELQGIRKYFSDDDSKRAVIEVTIERSGKSISFEYGLSLVDTEAFMMPKDFHGYKDFGNLFISLDGVPAHMKKDFIHHNGTALAGVYKEQKGTFYSYHGNTFTGLNTVRINKLKKIKKGLLYSILCSIRCDFYCPVIFEDFCGEYGYDEDSRKAYETWQNCLKQSQKIQSIFTEENADCLPA
jgi:hypothetical protein